MDYTLTKEPKKPTIISGFPGFGLVGTIAIEFLLEHLKAKEIGVFHYNELAPTLAIHNGKLIKPMSIWYVQEYNLVILHTILNVQGFEWDVTDQILKLAKQLNAKEIISLEGVSSPDQKINAYTFGHEGFRKHGAKYLEESIVMGVTACLMLKSNKIAPLFVGAHSQLPDSEAAAKLIELLDKYLGLNVDFKPLLEQAKEFEKKLKTIMKQSMQTQEEMDTKNLSYLG